jgi:hypothetical protein
MLNPEELALARLDNSALLQGPDILRLVIAAFGFDAIHSTTDTREDFFLTTLGMRSARQANFAI